MADFGKEFLAKYATTGPVVKKQQEVPEDWPIVTITGVRHSSMPNEAPVKETKKYRWIPPMSWDQHRGSTQEVHDKHLRQLQGISDKITGVYDDKFPDELKAVPLDTMKQVAMFHSKLRAIPTQVDADKFTEEFLKPFENKDKVKRIIHLTSGIPDFSAIFKTQAEHAPVTFSGQKQVATQVAKEKLEDTKAEKEVKEFVDKHKKLAHTDFIKFSEKKKLKLPTLSDFTDEHHGLIRDFASSYVDNHPEIKDLPDEYKAHMRDKISGHISEVEPERRRTGYINWHKRNAERFFIRHTVGSVSRVRPLKPEHRDLIGKIVTGYMRFNTDLHRLPADQKEGMRTLLMSHLDTLVPKPKKQIKDSIEIIVNNINRYLTEAKADKVLSPERQSEDAQRSLLTNLRTAHRQRQEEVFGAKREGREGGFTHSVANLVFKTVYPDLNTGHPTHITIDDSILHDPEKGLSLGKEKEMKFVPTEITAGTTSKRVAPTPRRQAAENEKKVSRLIPEFTEPTRNLFKSLFRVFSPGTKPQTGRDERSYHGSILGVTLEPDHAHTLNSLFGGNVFTETKTASGRTIKNYEPAPPDPRKEQAIQDVLTHIKQHGIPKDVPDHVMYSFAAQNKPPVPPTAPVPPGNSATGAQYQQYLDQRKQHAFALDQYEKDKAAHERSFAIHYIRHLESKQSQQGKGTSAPTMSSPGIKASKILELGPAKISSAVYELAMRGPHGKIYEDQLRGMAKLHAEHEFDKQAIKITPDMPEEHRTRATKYNRGIKQGIKERIFDTIGKVKRSLRVPEKGPDGKPTGRHIIQDQEVERNFHDLPDEEFYDTAPFREHYRKQTAGLPWAVLRGHIFEHSNALYERAVRSVHHAFYNSPEDQQFSVLLGSSHFNEEHLENVVRNQKAKIIAGDKVEPGGHSGTRKIADMLRERYLKDKFNVGSMEEAITTASKDKKFKAKVKRTLPQIEDKIKEASAKKALAKTEDEQAAHDHQLLILNHQKKIHTQILTGQTPEYRDIMFTSKGKLRPDEELKGTK